LEKTVGRTASGSQVFALHTALSHVEPRLSENERVLTAEVEDLKLIHALSLRLADANTLSDVLLDVLQTAANLVDARLGSVQLLTPEGKLGMIGQVGFGDSILDQFAFVSLEDCSTCAVALQRRSRVIVHDLRADADFSEIAASLRSYGAVGAVSTPVLDKIGKVLAMISVYWLDEHEPTDRELRALDLCAELAGRHVERSVAAGTLRDREQRQTLLMGELAHRGKNLLSVIQAIAGQSLRGDRTLDEAREVFIGRLGALAKTYDTLTDESPESVQLNDVVSAGLSSHSERASIRGPAVVVPAKNAQTLALVLHELATNAAKYGALSIPSGRIEVTWEVAGTGSNNERFLLEWTEINGPPADAPTRQGFGSVIITSVVGSELNCVPAMEFTQDGFRYRLECSLGTLTCKNP
jgi:two-component sensor histidine kinase